MPSDIHVTETFRPLKRRKPDSRKAKPTLEQERQLMFAVWRMDMWFAEQGTYEEIHRKVNSGELMPGYCPKQGCDCQWKHEEPPCEKL